MRALKRPSRGVRTQPTLTDEQGRTARTTGSDVPADLDESTDPDPDSADDAVDAADSDDEVYGIFRVYCPDCARPIALLADEEVLPEHALCSTPWNPFGLTVCAGSGRLVSDAEPLGDDEEGSDQDVAALLTLPAGLDWRTQPFSHAGGPGTRPMRLPRLRRRA